MDDRMFLCLMERVQYSKITRNKKLLKCEIIELNLDFATALIARSVNMNPTDLYGMRIIVRDELKSYFYIRG